MNKEKFSFKILKECNSARTGKINTHRGQIDTPTFMTVGTQGTIKATFMDDVIKAGAQIILSNTYHLMLRPGTERIKRVGGLHKFMNCKLPILTDSGGFQIMSLSKLVKIDKRKGAIFKSHIDGEKFILSPEKSIKIQKDLNSDIVMVLDECPKLSYNKKQINQLEPDENILKEKIKKFREDELHHKDIAYKEGATKKGLYKILDKIIKTGSKVAINISEKI